MTPSLGQKTSSPTKNKSPKNPSPKTTTASKQLELLARMVSPELLMNQESNPDGSLLPGSPKSRGTTPTIKVNDKPVTTKPENKPENQNSSWQALDDDENDLVMDVEQSSQPEETTV